LREITEKHLACNLYAYSQQLEKMDSKIQESHSINYAETHQKSKSPTASLKKITTTTWNSVRMETCGAGAK